MYFLPFPSSDWESGAKKHLSPEMLNVCIKRVLSELSLPARGERHWRKSDVSLLPHELLPFWSVEAFLGRWQAGAHESNEYIVTSREVVHRVQMHVVEKINCGHQGVDEQPLLDELQEFGNARNVSFARGASRHRVWQTNDEGHRALLLGFPLDYELEAGEAEGEAALEVAVEDDEEQQLDASACPYWVSVSRRSQFRRLHAKDKCGVLPWTVFRAEGFQSVDEAHADAWCKICWKKISHDGAEALSPISSQT